MMKETEMGAQQLNEAFEAVHSSVEEEPTSEPVSGSIDDIMTPFPGLKIAPLGLLTHDKAGP